MTRLRCVGPLSEYHARIARHRAKSRVGHLGRHPLCPGCGYDLVATLAERRNVCPECGVEFELHELGKQVLPGDWTPWRGAVRLSGVLAIRFLVCAVGWALSMYLVGLFTSATFWRGHIVVGLLVLVGIFLVISTLGVLVGTVIGHRLYEHAGADSMLFAAMGIACGFGAIIAGTALLTTIPTASAPSPLATSLACAFAAGVVIRKTLLADY